MSNMQTKLTSRLMRLFLQRYYLNKFKQVRGFIFDIACITESSLSYYRAESKWNDRQTDNNYHLKTYKAINGQVVTTINGRIIQEHETSNISMRSILKLHLSTLMKVLAAQQDPMYKYL